MGAQTNIVPRGFGKPQPARVEPGAERVAPRLVDPAHLERMVGPLVHGHDRRDLDRLERAVVEVRLQTRERRDHVGVADEEADPPPGHRERLRQGVQLDAALLGALDLEDRGRLVPVEGEVGVGEVVDDEQTVLAGEGDDPLHEVELDRRRGRVVRKREDHDARPWTGARVRLLEVGEEILVGSHRDLGHGRAGEDGRVDVNRIARARHERGVARLEQHPHQVREPLLRADRVQHLALRVELDAEAAPVEVGGGQAELGDPARGRVAMISRLLRRLDQLLDGELGRRQVRVAEAEVDHVLALPAERRSQLGDMGEDIRRERANAPELQGLTPTRSWTAASS